MSAGSRSAGGACRRRATSFGRRRLGARIGALAAAAAMAGACASLARQSRGAPEPVTVWVRNQALSPVHIYVAHGNARQSLGEVSSQDSASYQVPQAVLIGDESIRLIARQAAGGVGTYVSQELFPRPGDLIRLRIVSPLSQSYVMVR